VTGECLNTTPLIITCVTTEQEEAKVKKTCTAYKRKLFVSHCKPCSTDHEAGVPHKLQSISACPCPKFPSIRTVYPTIQTVQRYTSDYSAFTSL
jgi:hypothetical protein